MHHKSQSLHTSQFEEIYKIHAIGYSCRSYHSAIVTVIWWRMKAKSFGFASHDLQIPNITYITHTQHKYFMHTGYIHIAFISWLSFDERKRYHPKLCWECAIQSRYKIDIPCEEVRGEGLKAMLRRWHSDEETKWMSVVVRCWFIGTIGKTLQLNWNLNHSICLICWRS